MSSGQNDSQLKVDKDLNSLAPKFKAAVEAALAECQQYTLLAVVYEAYRSNELQALYFRRGRDVKPPPTPVTNARTNEFSWHGYGLAVDVIHKTAFWKPPGGGRWFAEVAEVFKRHGCSWGGNWTKPDPPHFQWAACMPSPSDEARMLLATQGVRAVWARLGAA